MLLEQILKCVDYRELRGSGDKVVEALSFDSRTVSEGTLFFAVRGTVVDGHNYIDLAVANGAVAVVCEQLPEVLVEGVSYVVVDDSNRAVAQASDCFFDHPSRKLRLVGITGTNGKTTIATLLYELFRGLGYKAGLISTVVYKIDTRSIASTHTTPDAIRINSMLAEMVEAGCDYCFMEVSSHSLVQERVAGLCFAGGVFTNLTHDHFDYHKTFAEYLKAKKRLFDMLPPEAFALTNADDRNGKVILQNCRSDRQRYYSVRGAGHYNCRVLEQTMEGMLLEIDSKQLWTRLVGRFNASNLTAIYATAMLLGAQSDEVLKILSKLGSVSGRFETIPLKNGATAVVDYAHTPDALGNVMDTVLEMGCVNRLIVVVGCGGDRDRTKRPEMAAIAVEKSFRAIFTSDNPRSENPDDIIADMIAGVGAHHNYVAVTDRRQAIRAALMMAEKGDVVLVAGKGHEDYQIVGGVRHHLSDKEEIKNF